MQYNGKELTEYKSDTPQFWPEGKEMLVWDNGAESEDIERAIVKVWEPRANHPYLALDVAGYWIDYAHAAEIPTTTKRRVTRAECAGMAVKHRDGSWTPFYGGWHTEKQWNQPMLELYIDRALTLADALAGRTLGMEVEE